jgi:hypothetical protein
VTKIAEVYCGIAKDAFIPPGLPGEAVASAQDHKRCECHTGQNPRTPSCVRHTLLGIDGKEM